MMKNKTEILCVVVFLIEVISVALAHDFYSRPNILLNPAEIIEANTNYSVFCQGNRPLRWITPEIKLEQRSWTKFLQVPELPPNKNFKYGLRLYITNISYPFVGYYNCHFEDAEDVTEENSENSRVYLFVNDKKHLYVKDENLENIFVKQGDIAIIPCRPTSPDVNVTLYKVDADFGEVFFNVTQEKDKTIYIYKPSDGIFTNQTLSEGNTLLRCDYQRNNVKQNQDDIPFDVKVGFSFKFLDISQIGGYVCSFLRDNESHDVIFDLQITDRPTSYIPAPSISDENKGHTVIGDTISVNCSLQYTKSSVTFLWIVPSGSWDSQRMNQSDTTYNSLLTVRNATLNDSGVYICKVSDHQDHHESRNITIKIFDKNEYDIQMNESTNNYYIEARAGEESVTWVVDVWGHPQPKFTWFNNNNNTIDGEKTNKYVVNYVQPKYYNQDEKEVIGLTILNIDIHDLGSYTLFGRNQFMEKTLSFFLNVTDKPSVMLKTDSFHITGVPGIVNCTAGGHPAPDFLWEYKPCLNTECDYDAIFGNIIAEEGLTITSQVTINATESGLVKCTATNAFGTESDLVGYYVSDVSDGFAITGFDDTVILNAERDSAIYGVGEKISVTCAAAATNYTDLRWSLNGQEIQQNKRISLYNTSTKYSNSAILEINKSLRDDSGTYECSVKAADGRQTKQITFNVTDQVQAYVVKTNMEDVKEEDFPRPVEMYCMTTGIPKPFIRWYKDNNVFEPKQPRIRFENSKQILKFNETDASDAGVYKCEVVYKNNAVDSREMKLKFKNAPGTIVNWLKYIILFLAMVSLILFISLFLKVRKERRLKREMKLLGLANFEKGAIENINPELGIDDQAELLPYDKKWEFPIENLKLGKQLGSGAFGVVLKGEAKFIIEGKPVTTVAVKMVKKNADNVYIKALASELKIMVHLGKHLNVVNLLGACTKNVAKKELLVIVEYCRFGNLQNYLLRHRNFFINQIDPQTGKVNYLIGQEFLDRTYSLSSTKSNVQSPLMRYATLAFSDSTNGCLNPPTSSMGDYRAHANSEATDMTTLTQGEDSIMLSNNSTQPEWRSNYKGDYKENVNPISTNNLMAYAFQVTRGMEYLASRKVLHGDLAARNILLSDNNVVKICDFGLAKSMYKSDNYKKSGDCPLPVKWMAIESIRDKIFSTQSDVWSFGIVLWELFSLGRTPYPGMAADERLYHKLVEGYRLECPEYCPEDVYQIMNECWSAKPILRPSFAKLTEKIGLLLEDNLRKHYIDLNDPYLTMNTKLLEGENDYLAMLSPPTFESIVSPNYTNDTVIELPPPEDGYMPMKPSTIFSPRVTDDGVFDFTAANRKDLTPDEEKRHELLPMLRLISEADSETPLNSPTNLCSVSNPTYHLSSTILDRDSNAHNEIVKSADNYVNMPQNKCLIKDKSACVSQSTIMDETKEHHQYVNEPNRDWNSIIV